MMPHAARREGRAACMRHPYRAGTFLYGAAAAENRLVVDLEKATLS